MFEKNRKYKNCIFCGYLGKLTREHIFGTALSKKFPHSPDWEVQHDYWQYKLSNRSSSYGGGSILNAAPCLACKSCNGGILKSSNENNTILNDLIKGHTKNFNLKEIVELKRFFERIAMIIDVCSSNLDISPDKSTTEYLLNEINRQHPPVISFGQREKWKKGEAIEGIDIYLGKHLGVLGLDPSPVISPEISLNFSMTNYEINISMEGKRIFLFWEI